MSADAGGVRQRRSAARFVGGAAIAVFGKVGYAALSYVSLVTAARLLGADQFGLYMLAVTASLSVTNIATLGAQHSIVALVPRYTDSQPDRARAVFATITRWVIVTALAMTAAMTAFRHPLATLLGQPRAAWYLGIVALSIPFSALLTVTRVGAQAVHAFVSSVATSLLLQIALFQIALLLGFFLGVLPSIFVAWAYVASFAAASAIALSTIARHPVYGKGWIRSPRVVESGMAGLSARFMGIQLLTNLNSSIVMYVIAMSLAAHDIAIFVAAQRTAHLVSFVLIGINFVFAPVVAAAWHARDVDQIGVVYKRATKWSIAISLPASIALVAAAPGVLGLFGPEYRIAIVAITWLAAGELVNAGTGSVGYLLMMTGRERTMLLNTLLATAFSAGAAWFAVPRFGVSGAAAVAGSVLAAFNLIMLLQVRLELGLMPYNRETLRVMACGVVAAVAGALVYPFAWSPTIPMALGLVMTVAAVVLTYAVAFSLIGFANEDRVFIRHVLMPRISKKRAERPGTDVELRS